MRTRVRWPAGFIVMVALGFAFAGAPLAQTTSKVDVRNFEVISVDGNKLVVRDERGTNEITVPDDFRLTVDGKKMAASELKPGMKGTATVTTTTTVKPVFVTEYKDGVVLKSGPGSMVIRDAQGVRKRFTQDQLDERGVQIVKDGRVIRIGELKEGDAVTATIVSKAEPVVVTEQEVQATLAQAKSEPATTPAATTAAAPQSASTAPPGAAPKSTAAQPASPASEPAGLGMTWYVLIAVLVAAALFFFARRRKAT